MPTIADKLLNLGVRQAQKVWGRPVQNLRTGLVQVGEFEEVEPIMLGSEFGDDPREGSWFHFMRPLPDIIVTDILKDGDGNKWMVLKGWENHPYKPRAKVKVQRGVPGKDSWA